MRILVTGGAGYIGSHTCVLLLEAGYDVCVVDNLSNSNEKALSRIEEITGKKLDFHKIDLLDYNKLNDVFEQYSFDSVIHFAGLKAVGESVKIPLKYYHNNITGTINLLNIMQKHNVKQLVFSSSATVYGNPETVPINENSPLNAVNPYGQTKLTIEYILKDLYNSDKEFQIAILRYFNPVGAHKSGRIGEDPNGIPNNLMPFIAQVAVGKLECLSIYGNDYDTHDGTGVRDYIHVMDLSYGHLLALKKWHSHKEHNTNEAVDIKTESSGVEIYNLGTGIGYSVLDMVHAFEKASGRKVNYKIVSRRAGDTAECYADPTLAEKELGFKAEYGIDEMCKDTYNWQEGNPNGYK